MSGLREGTHTVNKVYEGNTTRYRAYYGRHLVLGREAVPPDTVNIVTSVDSLEVLEGETTTFEVWLSKQPQADVTVTLAETSPDFSVSPTSLSFTPTNWRTPRVIQVRTVHDSGSTVDEHGDITLTLVGAGTSDTKTVAVTVVDNDVHPNVIVSPRSASVAEGNSVSFQVSLDERPYADVLVELSHNNTSLGSLNRYSFYIHRDNWNMPERNQFTLDTNETDTTYTDAVILITVHGIGGGVDDTETVRVTITNDDVAPNSLVVSDPGGFVLDEGTSRNVTVHLNREPTGDVAVAISESSAELTLNKTSLTFTQGNWFQDQVVTITARSDATGEDHPAVDVTFTPSGGNSDGIARIVPVGVRDLTNPELVLSKRSLSVTEGVTTYMSFTVKLSKVPLSAVRVTVSSGSHLYVNPADRTLDFTTTNWNTPQTVEVRAADDADAVDDTDEVSLEASGGSTDTAVVTVRVTDDDEAPKVVLSSTTLSIVEGNTSTVNVTLDGQPSGPVSVSIEASPAAVNLDKTQMTFLTTNFSTPQVLNITAPQDPGSVSESVTITFRASGGGIQTAPVTLAVNVIDDDSAVRLDVDPFNLTINEGGSGRISVGLTAAPADQVNVRISSDNPSVTVSPMSMSFDQNNFVILQYVTVSAEQDSDFNNEHANITLTATGQGVNNTFNVGVLVTDDDASPMPQFEVSRITAYPGGRTQLGVRLSARPASNVTVTLSENVTGLSVSPRTLRFTTSNWSRYQYINIDVGSSLSTGSYSIFAQANGGGADTTQVSATVDIASRPRVLLSGTSFSVEEGESVSLGIRLSAEPSSNVTVNVTNAGDNVHVARLTFTPLAWSGYQYVTFYSREDTDFEDETVRLTVVGSGGGVDTTAQTVTVTVTDEPLPARTWESPNSHTLIGHTVTSTVFSVGWVPEPALPSEWIVGGNGTLDYVHVSSVGNWLQVYINPIHTEFLSDAIDGLGASITAYDEDGDPLAGTIASSGTGRALQTGGVQWTWHDSIPSAWVGNVHYARLTLTYAP